MNPKVVKTILEELHAVAWEHTLTAQKLLSRIRDLENMVNSEIGKEENEKLKHKN